MNRRFHFRRHSLLFSSLAAIVLANAQRTAADDTPAPPEAPADTTPIVSENAPRFDLRYKCAIGDILRYEVSHRAAIRSTIDQTTQSAQTRTESSKSWRITDVLSDGTIEFMTVVERVHMVNQLPDKDPTEYDSQRDKTPPPGFEDAARSVGVPLSLIRMTPQGKILRRDIRVKRQGDDDDGPTTVLLPPKPVAIGETWDEPFDLTVVVKTGGTKLVQTRRHYKLTSVTAGMATISVNYQVLTPIDAHIESQLVQRLMDGEVRFDIDAGRVIGQKMDIDKRILGFAGPTSSMQYVVRMEEKLVVDAPKVTAKPAPKPAPQSTDTTRTATPVAPAPTQSQATKTPATTPNTPRTATRPRTQPPAKGYIRR